MTKESIKNFKSGIVSIIGRPNTGKSTLLNCILQKKVAIVSEVPQTTRHQIRGIYNDERGQIVFIDTPGFHKPKDGLGRRMSLSSQEAYDGADCLIHLVDTSEPTGEEERFVVEQIKPIKVPVIVGLNKIDLKGKYVDQYIALWEKAKGKPLSEDDAFVLLPLSGKSGFNIEKLLEIIFGFLSAGPALYPSEVVSDVPQRLAIADIVREKLFWALREELPHSLAVITEDIRSTPKKVTVISVLILVERESQKEIVIGEKGQVLKKVGTLARAELEKLLQAKVFLELFVKVEKNWRNDAARLQDMGFEGQP